MSSSYGLHMSRHFQSYRLGDDNFAVWNSLFPSMAIIDSEAMATLRQLPSTSGRLTSEDKAFLLDHRLVFEGAGDKDPYDAEFFATAEAMLTETDEAAHAFYSQKQSFLSLYLVNSGCNLGCKYCVSYAGDDYRTKAARMADRGDERCGKVLDVVDQYIRRRAEFSEPANFAFNGGEILLRWPLIKEVLEHVSRRYPSVPVYAEMNTNATLITDEIARDLDRFGVKIHVSVDGYKENHDRTRIYHGGNESFEHVIAGIQTYNRHNPSRVLDSVQGTIEDVENFDTEEFAKTARFGFKASRLEPNLLKARPEKGVTAAQWEAQLVVDTQDGPVMLVNTHFNKMCRLLGELPKGFSYNCNGLSGARSRILTLNIDSMQLSLMCSFVSPAAVSLAAVGNDIYHPMVWKAARNYIVRRIEMLRGVCSGCDVLGSCQGACVLNGLDLANEINPASCAYQRACWRHAIDYSYSGRIRPLEVEEVDRACRGHGGVNARRCLEVAGCSPSEHSEKGANVSVPGRIMLPVVRSS